MADPGNTIVRDELITRIRPGIKREWRLVDTQRVVDRVNRITLVVRQSRIEKDPANPARSRRAFFELVLASPLDATGAAELELDDELVDFLSAIDSAKNVVWDTATKGIWSDAIPAPCYVITCWITYTKGP